MMDIKLAWRAWKTRYRDQVFELRAIRQALRGGGVALDVGANKGSYLYSMARWAGTAQVVAFEPQRTLAQYLAGACQRSGLTNVTVENLALSNQQGELQLFVPGNSHSPGASLEASIADKTDCHTETVRVTTLDAYAAEKLHAPVRVIKMDVEGHELAVLQGALTLIRRDKPLLVIECEGRHLPSGKTVQDFITLVESLGYSATLAMPGIGELPAAEFREALHQRQAGERFWDAKDYYNNFIFRPRAEPA
ncbi:MAG: FkbM family methyltransferase [Polaromonas sp.]|uniref:FkbM family methyltransferase n=1 Tax=Polaromonas sp. TaxID=1869339 RepID=UPI0027352DD7|nr:FkbM family methyltransferase [Polaromonas sp.]MDP2819021.1 FkbM family methyltransferase [Polaromonas sp.]